MAYVILEATEYPAMSGSNTICVATVLLETGILPMTEPVTELVLEAPAGLIKVRCDCRDGKVKRVEFVNQPAFCYELGRRIIVDGIGEITVDIAYGGMTYAIADAGALGFRLDPSEARDLCTLGQRIKKAAAEQITVKHPENPAIPGITQTLFAGPLTTVTATLRSRNAVVVSPGRIDRSPCGTGTCARLAVLHAKGLISPGQSFIHESIIGTTFDSSIAETTTIGPYGAVVPVVAGQAWIAGIYQMGLDPTDPFPAGFTCRTPGWDMPATPRRRLRSKESADSWNWRRGAGHPVPPRHSAGRTRQRLHPCRDQVPGLTRALRKRSGNWLPSSAATDGGRHRPGRSRYRLSAVPSSVSPSCCRCCRCLLASCISTRVAGERWASWRVMKAKVSYSGGSRETQCRRPV